MSFLYLPFIIQGILMSIDENLHQKRGLGLWERLGHPLDTLTVLVAVSFVSMNEMTDQSFLIFIILSVFSCLFITKDEFVHTRECSGFENWLHACLYIIHPLIFLSTGLMWKYDSENLFLNNQPMIVAAFMVYQILRWSIPWKQITK